MGYLILAVDDEREVLDAIAADLAVFSKRFKVEIAESAAEALAVIEDAERNDDRLALIICDHLMPGTLGVDFLIRLHGRESSVTAKKVLLTGQASHQDTIAAINRAGLDHYFSKPWEPSEFQNAVRNLLTDFILEHDENPIAYADVLNTERLFTEIHQRGLYP